MKSIYQFLSYLLCAIIILNTLALKAQNPKWVSPPNVIEFTSSSYNFASLPGTPSILPSNGMVDVNGNLLFYVKGSTVYDANGISIGSIINNSLKIHEINIVRVPGSCDLYYIIHAGNGKLRYTVVEADGSSVNFVSGKKNVPFGDYSDGKGYSFAISKRNNNEVRNLYASEIGYIIKYNITHTDISFEDFIIASGNNIQYAARELELSPDGTKLAWGNSGSGNKVSVIELDSNGDYVSDQTFTVPNINRVNGVEFSPNSNKLFVASGHPLSSSSLDGINVIDLNQNTITHIPNSIAYGRSHIELGLNNMLFVTSNSSLATIDPNTNTLSDVALFAAPAINGTRLLPDQVDGDDYAQLERGIDLWIVDGVGDVGNEPVQAGVNIWEGEIWNCEDDPNCLSMEKPEFKVVGDNYLRVRVKNRGCLPSQNADLHLYWTRARTGEYWDWHWLDPALSPGNIIINPGSSGSICAAGGEITVVPGTTNPSPISIPSIPPGGEVVLTQNWKPLNPDICYPLGTNGIFNNFSEPMICFLARIVSLDDPITNEQLMSPIKPNVQNNNNIATVNTHLVNLDLFNKVVFGSPIMANFDNYTPQFFSLHFNQYVDNGLQPFNEIGQVRLQMSDHLWEDWNSGGLTGEGIEIIGENEVLVNDLNAASLNNIVYQSERYYNIWPVFEVNPAYQFEEMDQFYHFQINHTTTTEPTGNSAGTYQVRLTTDCDLDVRNQVMINVPGECTTIGTSIDCENCIIEWSPSTGLTNPNSSSTNVCVNESAIYTLTVLNPETGCSAQETVEVFVNNMDEPNERRHKQLVNQVEISPNPINTKATIRLDLVEPALTSIRIYDLTGQLVAQPLQETKYLSGVHTLIFDALSLAKGIYICEVTIGEQQQTQRLIIQ